MAKMDVHCLTYGGFQPISPAMASFEMHLPTHEKSHGPVLDGINTREIPSIQNTSTIADY